MVSSKLPAPERDSAQGGYGVRFVFPVRGPGGAILRGLTVMTLQLGLPNQVPVPSDGLDDFDKDLNKSPKRSRGAGAGVKMPPQTGVTIEAIQQLLAQQSATLMEAQRETVAQLESRQNEKIKGLEQKMGQQAHVSRDLHTAIKDLEDRMAKVEHAGKQAPAISSGQDPRRLTLVFGGWGKQTRRHVILHQLGEAVQKLSLGAKFDSAPFTTGPRRSVALCNFQQRSSEGLGDTRGRMLEIITAVNSAKALLTGGDRPLWCSFSRTPEERGKASLPGFTKKVVMAHKPQAKEDLDVEYASGMSWMDDAQLTGMGEGPTTEGILKVDTRAGPGWVDLRSLASKAGVSREVVAQMASNSTGRASSARVESLKLRGNSTGRASSARVESVKLRGNSTGRASSTRVESLKLRGIRQGIRGNSTGRARPGVGSARVESVKLRGN